MVYYSQDEKSPDEQNPLDDLSPDEFLEMV